MKHQPWEPPDDDTHAPFLVKCSRAPHGGEKLLYRGIVVTQDGPAMVEWVERGQNTMAPWMGEPKPDGDRTVALRCRFCRLDRKMQMSLFVKAIKGLAAAGTKDNKGRVILDIAYVPR